MNKAFLKDLLETVSVSGEEIALQRKIIEHMQPLCDTIQTDASGNVISIVNPNAEAKVLLCGHVDEIGFFVNRICDNGMLKVIQAGGVHPVLYLGTHVQVLTKQGVLHGVVVTNRGLEQKEKVVVDDLFIDIGCHDRKEAVKYVSIGDVVVAASGYADLLEDRFCARAIDDRGGAFIILEALRRAKQRGAKAGIYAATTTGEETTRRGAYHAATSVKPDCAIVVDVTFASDYPGAEKNEGGDITLGKGAVLCQSSIVNKKLNTCFQQLAEAHQIPVQWEITPGFTFTDGDTVHLSNQGIPIVLVSLPLRYMHSSIETADWQDVESCIALITEFLVMFSSDVSFDPFA